MIRHKDQVQLDFWYDRKFVYPGVTFFLTSKDIVISTPMQTFRAQIIWPSWFHRERLIRELIENRTIRDIPTFYAYAGPSMIYFPIKKEWIYNKRKAVV